MRKEMIYFDSAAAMRPSPEVLDFYRRALDENFANQEAAHGLGFAQRKRLKQAARQLSAALTAREDYAVVWGSCATELFNLVADSPFAAGQRVLTTRLEHPALTATLRRSAGSVVYEGKADFAACFLVQSETGLRQDTECFFNQAPGAVRMLDAVQGAAKLPVPEAELIVVSGHKFGAPGGGAILVHPAWKQKSEFLDFAHGYRHKAYRSCRPETALLLTMAFAAEHTKNNPGDVRRIHEFLRGELAGLPLPGGKESFCTLPPEKSSPCILHLMLPGVETGVIVRMLSEYGIMVAAGSACSSESNEPSAVLRELGFPRRDGWSGLRLSFSNTSTMEEAKKLTEAFREILKNY